MEARGISVDRQILSRLSGELAQRAAGLEDEIYALAGPEIQRCAPPSNWAKSCLEKWAFPAAKKTKSGPNTLRVLRFWKIWLPKDTNCPRKIVDWRQMTKLKSTYTDALPGYINDTTKRVHTSYAMASTSTGRLSSSDPNLQKHSGAHRRGSQDTNGICC